LAHHLIGRETRRRREVPAPFRIGQKVFDQGALLRILHLQLGGGSGGPGGQGHRLPVPALGCGGEIGVKAWLSLPR